MKKDLLFLTALIIGIIVLLFLAKTYSFIPQFRTGGLTSTQINIKGTSFTAEIADTNQERSKGLSNRDNLAENTGMLFVFETAKKYKFWMKDTNIPLDIIWISKDKKIVDYYLNAQPQPGTSDSQLKRYSPSQEALYVLEIPAGSISQYDIEIGDSVNFSL